MRRQDVTVGADDAKHHDMGDLNTPPVVLAVVFLILGEVFLIREEPESLLVDRMLELVQELLGLAQPVLLGLLGQDLALAALVEVVTKVLHELWYS